MEFDQQQLRQAIVDANKKSVEQTTIVWLAERLGSIKRRHHARQAKREQVHDQKGLLEAVLQIRDSADSILKTLNEQPTVAAALNEFKRPAALIASKTTDGIAQEIKEVRSLRNTAEQVRYHLEVEYAGLGRQHIQTDLELDLYDAYCGLTGKKGMGSEKGEGPLYRFEKACLALIDPDLEIGTSIAFRLRLMEAHKRRREEITRKDKVQIDPPNDV